MKHLVLNKGIHSKPLNPYQKKFAKGETKNATKEELYVTNYNINMCIAIPQSIQSTFISIYQHR
jgi:hypothetical protein